MKFELTATPPPAVLGIGSREYNRYDEHADALRAQPGMWLRLSTVEIVPREIDGKLQTMEEAEKDARKRAGNRVAMIRQGKGAFSGAEWNTVVAQPGGAGTAFELHVSFVRDLPRVETPAEPEATDGENATDAAGAVDVSADATADAAVSADAEAQAEPAAVTAQPAGRRRRG